jgi:O-antigen/teichoic acid export membrane protein
MSTVTVAPSPVPLGGRLRELIQHTAVYGLGPVLGQLAAFVLLPLYTHLLSPKDYGTLEIIVLASAFLNVFLGLQTVTQILRLYHAADRDEDRRQAVSTGIALTAIVTAGAMLPAHVLRDQLSRVLLGTPEYGTALSLALWSVVASNVLASSLAYLRARKLSRAYTLLSVAHLVGALSLNLVFVVWLRRGVEGILLSQLLVSGALAIGVTAWVLRRTGVAISAPTVRTMLAFGIPMTGWSLAYFVVHGADRLALSGVASLTDVGVYSLANRFGTSLLVFVVTPFSCFWSAERFAVAKQPGGRDVIARIFTYFMVLLCFVGLAVSVWMDELVRLMASKEFWAAAAIGPVLVLAYVLWGAFDALTTGIVIEGGTKAVGVLTAMAAAVHVALCVGLGHVFLTAGVAWAKVITAAVLTVGVYVIAQRRYPIAYEVRRVAKVLAVAVALFLASTYVNGHPPLLGIVLKAPLIVAFPLLLGAVGFLEPAERQWVQASIRATLGRWRPAPAAVAERRGTP